MCWQIKYNIKCFVEKNLVKNFSDSEVGYVSGKMIYIKEDGSTIGEGCSIYRMPILSKNSTVSSAVQIASNIVPKQKSNIS